MCISEKPVLTIIPVRYSQHSQYEADYTPILIMSIMYLFQLIPTATISMSYSNQSEYSIVDEYHQLHSNPKMILVCM